MSRKIKKAIISMITVVGMRKNKKIWNKNISKTS